MSDVKQNVLQIPNPPKPMTASILMSYLESMADSFEIENEPIMINGSKLTNAKVVDNRVVLMTHKDMLNEDPPCKNHIPVQHRDGKSPWCEACGLSADWEDLHG